MDIDNLAKIKYWGASTSAHQVEGRNHNQWSVWELAHAKELASTAEQRLGYWLPKWQQFKEEASNPDNYVSGLAVDHYGRFEEDFDIAKGLNLNAFRFSIEWSRIEPKEGKWDEEAIGHYRQVLQALHRRGMEPFVCLWHWTVPVWFDELGGFTKKSNIDYFVRFCEKVAVELGEYMTYVIILNEPNVYTGQSYSTGEWPPNQHSWWQVLKVYNNLIRAHKVAYHTLRPINKRFKMGIAQHQVYIYQADQSWLSGLVRKSKNLIWNKWFFNRSEQYHDFIGINFYHSDRLVKGRVDNPNRRQNDLGWNMEPANLQFVLEAAYQEYHKPIVVTENGLADWMDESREWWLSETMKALAKAVDSGVEIDGYMHWSLVDNFEWAFGWWPRFGLVEVDRSDKKLIRNVRPSARWWAKVLAKIQARQNDG